MSKLYLGNNVPEVYSYPFTRNEVKSVARELTQINEFSYVGISPHDKIKDEGKEIWLGYVHAKKSEGIWSFSLSIYANRTEHFVEECKTVLLSDASKWVAMQLNQPESFPDSSNSLYISITNKNGKYKSNSKELTKTQWHLA